MIKVKDKNVKQSRIEFEFMYVEDFGLQAGGIFGIIFVLLILIVSIAATVVWYLNKIGKIKIYIPRKFRVFCFKNWLSEEEKASGEYVNNVDDNVKTRNELRMRVGIQPSGQNGYIVHDSFFSDHCEEDNFKED